MPLRSYSPALLLAAVAFASATINAALALPAPNRTEIVALTPGGGAVSSIFQFLGGLRTLVADAAWLRAMASWADGDASRVENEILVAIALRPENRYFWREGAETIAYDLPSQRILGLRRAGTFSEAAAREIKHAYANKGLALLQQAHRIFPGSPVFQSSIGRLYLGPLDDRDNAAPWFRQAAMQDRFVDGQLYLQILDDAGRYEEALAFIKEWLPVFEDPRNLARKPLIEIWAKELEKELRP